jgi:multidrug efflux pump subunit AcrB
VTLKPWDDRHAVEEQLRAILTHANQALAKIPEGVAFIFPPPAIPGIGASGGVTFLLEDLAGMDVKFLAQHYPEIHRSRQPAARNRQDHDHFIARRASVFSRRRSGQGLEAGSSAV